MLGKMHWDGGDGWAGVERGEASASTTQQDRSTRCGNRESQAALSHDVFPDDLLPFTDQGVVVPGFVF